MEIDNEKIDEVVMALFYLYSWDEEFGTRRAWKNIAWEITDRLHEKELISDPKGKAKSIYLYEEGKEFGRAMAEKWFSADLEN